MKTTVTRATRNEVIESDWGRLDWFANGKIGNSETMTAGICTLRPGQGNPHHHHPNCSEVLFVYKGRIKHTAENGDVELNEGDSISIPVGFAHNAVNIGDDDAVLFVVFDSFDRQTVGE